MPPPLQILIGSPLEPDQVSRIAAAFPDQITLHHRPDLLPPPRYQGDHNGDPTWRRTAAQEAEWLDLLRHTEALFDFPAGIQANLPAHCPHLRWIQTTSAGVGPAAQRLGLRDSGVIITTASGLHARPLTEFVFAVLLSHVKQLPHLAREQRAHRWQRHSGRGLSGKTLAIIGPGRIGREIARVARTFDMTVWAMASDATPGRATGLGVDRLVARQDLHAMLAAADAVVLCAPHTPDTDNLIGSQELAALKSGVVLINIARGALIDEDALITALQRGQIGLAALDVVRNEPLDPGSPLWDLPNVLISPHSASTIDDENRLLTDRFITNLGHLLSGNLEAMSPRLDLHRGY